MSAWEEILRRARYLGRRSEFDRELETEVQFHIEARAEELEHEGVATDAAREQARREFGPRARMSEDTRGAWQFAWLEDLWRDLRYAVRASTQSPGFTAIAVLSLAMGVGANCGMFIFVDGMLLRPLAVPRASELVTVHETDLQTQASLVSYRDYIELRDRAKTFDGLLALTPVNIGFAARPGVPPRTKDGQLVTANYFDVLGVKPALGRSFLPQEDAVPGRDAVVILSHYLWQQEFGSDPAVLGKPVWIGGIAFTVVGITPASFVAIDDDLTDAFPDYYVPMMMAPRVAKDADLLEKRDIRTLTLLGRLRRGVTMKQGQAEVATFAANLAAQYPENRDRSMAVLTVLRYRTVGAGGVIATMVMTLSGCVLLVACFNVAGLLTSRAAFRAKEISMRLAIGAGRPRLIRQLLTENLLLAVGGGLLGVAVGYIPVPFANRMVRQFDPNAAPQEAIALDHRVVLFSMAVALLSVLVFGLAPALQATRTDLSSAMKGAVPPRRRRFFPRMWGRNLLVTGQVAISVLLLTVWSVIYVGIHTALVAVKDQGFLTDHVLTATFDPLVNHYKDAQSQHFYEQLLERLRSAPASKSATLGSANEPVTVLPEGTSPPTNDPGKDPIVIRTIWAENHFFDALAIPLVQGRGFTSQDSASAPPVAVVNESLAKRYWPGQSAVGKRLRIGDNSESVRWVEIVGVSTIKGYNGFFQIPPPDLIFFPASQNPKHPVMTLFARSEGETAALAGALRSAVREVDPTQAVPEIHPWQYMYDAFEKGARLGTQMIGAMGAMGMLLALVGLYGLVAYDVNTRTREIGIRMALGAARGKVLRMMLRQGLAPAAFGIGAGLLLNYAVARILMAYFAANINPKGGGLDIDFSDWSLAGLVLAVLSLTVLAAYIPARRASRVDPNVALRCE